MLSSDPLSVLYYLVFGNMSAIETWLATDNPLRNLLSVAWQRTTDYVPGTIFAPGTILT